MRGRSNRRAGRRSAPERVYRPSPPPKHKAKAQSTVDLEDEYGTRKPNDYINEVRAKVAAWRSLGDAGLRSTVTPITARLLRHWRDPGRTRQLFFCQIEAAETAIWLTEVAPRQEIERLRAFSAEANSPPPDRVQARYRSRQDDLYGHADRMADAELGSDA